MSICLENAELPDGLGKHDGWWRFISTQWFGLGMAVSCDQSKDDAETISHSTIIDDVPHTVP